MTQPVIAPPGEPVRLAGYDARYHGDLGKAEGKALRAGLRVRVNQLQDRLYADGRFAVLVVLQGIDTAGKDSTIKSVFREVGPIGCRVESFGIPSEEELAHDFLWRYHRRLPRKRQLTIFNRSYYEGVLVERVKGIVPGKVWRPRYEQINAFERMLASEATVVLKFFLHISNEEQRERLQSRVDDPTKRWKFHPGDLSDRKRWDDFERAFEEMIEHTSTPEAPWHIVPADRKWYRDIVVAQALIERLEALDLRYPEPVEGIAGTVVV